MPGAEVEGVTSVLGPTIESMKSCRPSLRVTEG